MIVARKEKENFQEVKLVENFELTGNEVGTYFGMVIFITLISTPLAVFLVYKFLGGRLENNTHRILVSILIGMCVLGPIIFKILQYLAAVMFIRAATT